MDEDVDGWTEPCDAQWDDQEYQPDDKPKWILHAKRNKKMDSFIGIIDKKNCVWFLLNSLSVEQRNGFGFLFCFDNCFFL